MKDQGFSELKVLPGKQSKGPRPLDPYLDSPIDIKSSADDADPRMWRRLFNNTEKERYEKLVEMEVRGVFIPYAWRLYKIYFELTEAYLEHLDYWEERRAIYKIMWQID